MGVFLSVITCLTLLQPYHLTSVDMIKRSSDKILVLGDGCVEEVGTFEQLSSNENSRFSAFLKIYFNAAEIYLQHWL